MFDSYGKKSIPRSSLAASIKIRDAQIPLLHKMTRVHVLTFQYCIRPHNIQHIILLLCFFSTDVKLFDQHSSACFSAT